jgi:hypothetical protein
MTSRDLRNLVLAALAAALCFGGSFTCTTNTDSDKFDGRATLSVIPR